MRLLLTLLLALVPLTVTAGQLRVRLDSCRKTCVGEELMVYTRVENFNASFSVHSVVTTVTIKSGANVVGTKTLSPTDLDPLEVETLSVATGWIPTLAGAYTVEVSADGTDDINGPQAESKPLVVCENAPCPDRPTASGMIIYLGDGTTGSVTYSSPKPECCYEVKFTIASGREAVTAHSPEQWTKVPPTATVSVTVNRIKWNDTYIVGRLDWRTCDRTKSGSDYILIRDGTKPQASAPTPAPPPVTAGQTPHAGSDGDPVVTSQREFVHSVATIDAETIAEVPVKIQRDYLSQLAKFVPNDHDFGPGWTHEYDWYAVRGDDEVYVHGPAGFRARFRKSGANWFLDWPQDGGSYSLSVPNDSTVLFGDAERVRAIGFDKTGRIAFVDNTYGYRNTVNWNGRWINSITTPSGKGLTFTRDTSGYITGIGNGVYNVQYSYTNGILTGFTDGRGNTTRYNYVIGTNFLTSWQTPEGRVLFTNEYDTDGLVTRQDYGDGFTVNYTTSNSLTTLTYPLGVTRAHKHDSKGQLTEMTGPSGNRASLRYDNNGNRNSVTDMEGSLTTRTYANGMITSQTLPNGGVWEVGYRDRNYQGLTFRDVEMIGLKDGYKQSIERNPNGTVKTISLPNGRKTEYEYGAGHLPIRIRGFGFDDTYTYNTDGLVTGMQSMDGTMWSYTRTGNNEIKEIKKGSDVAASLTYDLNGDITKIIAGTQTWNYTYDKDRNTVTTTDPQNRMWQTIRDQRNRVIEFKNPMETAVKYSWIGPLMTTIEFDGGVKYTLTPNAEGFPATITNSKGDSWSVQNNSEGVPVTYTLPGSLKWNYTSNEMGFITDRTSPLGASHKYDFDLYGLMNSYTDPDGVTTTAERQPDLAKGMTKIGAQLGMAWEYQYTANGILNNYVFDANDNRWSHSVNGATNTTTLTSPLGKVVTAKGSGSRATEIDWGGGLKLTYNYTNGTSTGMTLGAETRTWRTNNVGEYTNVNGDSITRDNAGRILTINGVSSTRGPSGRVNGYQYDMMPVYSYGFDERGYVSSITDEDGGTTTVHTNPRGRITGYDFPGGFKINYEWNNDDQIAKVSTSDGWWMNYTRDRNGRIESIERSDNIPFTTPSAGDVGRTYDEDDKEIGATYDVRGNYQYKIQAGLSYNWGSFDLKGFNSGGLNYTTQSDAYNNTKTVTQGNNSYSFVWNPATSSPTLVKMNALGVDYSFIGLPNSHLLYSLNSQGKRRFFIDDGMGNVVAERTDDGTYDAARAFTPYGATVGITGKPGVFGYKGVGGGLSFGYNDEIMLNGHNVYNPDYGRFMNNQGVLFGMPSNVDPRTENEQHQDFRYGLRYTWNGMPINTDSYYQNPCSVDPGGLSITEREPYRLRFDIDPWNINGGRRNQTSDNSMMDSWEVISRVIREGYSKPQRTEDIEGFATRYRIDLGWNKCYGSNLKLSDRLITDIKPYQESDSQIHSFGYYLFEDYINLLVFLNMLFPDRESLVNPAPAPQPESNHQTTKKK